MKSIQRGNIDVDSTFKIGEFQTMTCPCGIFCRFDVEST